MMQQGNEIVGQYCADAKLDDGAILGLTIGINTIYNAPIVVSEDGTEVRINVKGLGVAVRLHIQELLTKSGYTIQQ